MEPFIKRAGLTNKNKEERLMKKTIFTALSLVLSLAVLPLYAEKGGKGNGDGKRGHKMGMHQSFMRLNMMQDKLGLTDSQVDRMYKIEKDYTEKSYQNRNNPDKIKALRDEQRKEMENVLTSEQKIKKGNFAKDFKSKKGNDKSAKNEKGTVQGEKKGGQGHYMNMMQDSLGLTNDQCDKIFKIHTNYMDQFYNNRKNETKIKELHVKQMDEIRNVLTPEQKTKLDEKKKNFKNGNKDKKKK